MISQDLAKETSITMLLAVYVVLIIALTKPLYAMLIRLGWDSSRAKYLNRKIIHIMAGGFVAILVPIVYTSPLLPFLASLGISVILLAARRLRPFDWFQVPDNHYEVNFALMWGISLTVLWLVTGNPAISILPALFMSFGDGVTGIVRNIMVKQRSKHWSGSVAMAIISTILGFIYGGIVGVISAIVATIAERFEFKPIDDNVIVPISAMIVIILLV